MGAGIAGKSGRVVPQHGGEGFHIHSILQCQGQERMMAVMEANPF